MTTFPETRRDDVVETLHGVEVADPYRWLEDPNSPETAEWVRRQNAHSEEHLSSLPERDWFAKTMAAIIRRPRAGVPARHAGRYLVSRNDGQQNQDVIFVADSLDELLAGGRILVDPNALSPEGTSAIGSLTVSPDGRSCAYGVSEAGSDWQRFVIRDVDTGDVVEDGVVVTKFSEATWLPDGRSYLYLDFDHAAELDGHETTALRSPRLRLHRLGGHQPADEVVAEFPDDDQTFASPELSHDDRWVVISVGVGTESRNRVWVAPVTTEGGVSELGPVIRVLDEPVAEFAFVRVDGSGLILRTDLDAPHGRVVRCTIEPAPRLVEVVAESADNLVGVTAAGAGLIATYLADAQPVLRRFALDGAPLPSVEVDGGALVALNAEAEQSEVFVGFSTVTTPTLSFAVDAGTGAVRRLDALVPRVPDPGVAFTPPEILTERRAATSPDGTRVPYFLVSAAETDHATPRPTLLWGYGGFNIPVFADYRPGWSAWLAAGGVLAVANLRGGGEFGTDWYEAGLRGRKQNVFDDFAAVAEHLATSGVTTAAQLAVYGRSNGGLLVGATLTQRPELVGAVVVGVGVLDMLRFHRFTIGAAWKSDYGDPDTAEGFAAAYAYSPLHNVRSGTRYPPTLVLTGDHDDRVVPLHSHKFTAALQQAQADAAPVVARIETAAGHGMGKPASMVASEWADLLAFAAHHTGLLPDPRSELPETD